ALVSTMPPGVASNWVECFDMTASQGGGIERDQMLGGEEEPGSRLQRCEPAGHAVGGRHRAETREIHETIFHAVTGDIVDLARELLDGHERQRRQRRRVLK